MRKDRGRPRIGVRIGKGEDASRVWGLLIMMGSSDMCGGGREWLGWVAGQGGGWNGEDEVKRGENLNILQKMEFLLTILYTPSSEDRAMLMPQSFVCPRSVDPSYISCFNATSRAHDRPFYSIYQVV